MLLRMTVLACSSFENVRMQCAQDCDGARLAWGFTQRAESIALGGRWLRSSISWISWELVGENVIGMKGARTA